MQIMLDHYDYAKWEEVKLSKHLARAQVHSSGFAGINNENIYWETAEMVHLARGSRPWR